MSVTMTVPVIPIEGSRTRFNNMLDISGFHYIDEQGRRPTYIAQKVRIVHSIVGIQHTDEMLA